MARPSGVGKKFFRLAIKWLKIRRVILQSGVHHEKLVLKISFDIIREQAIVHLRDASLEIRLSAKLRFIYVVVSPLLLA